MTNDHQAAFGGHAKQYAEIRHSCGLYQLHGITVCPGCGKVNEFAGDDGYVEQPREYHADCWHDDCSMIVFRSASRMDCVQFCRSRGWNLDGFELNCHAPTRSAVSPNGRADWIVTVSS